MCHMSYMRLKSALLASKPITVGSYPNEGLSDYTAIYVMIRVLHRLSRRYLAVAHQCRGPNRTYRAVHAPEPRAGRASTKEHVDP